jgi:predicted small lipoprotein YifL
LPNGWPNRWPNDARNGNGGPVYCRPIRFPAHRTTAALSQTDALPRTTTMRIAIAVLMALALQTATCGQRGPLELPPEPTARADAVRSASDTAIAARRAP